MYGDERKGKYSFGQILTLVISGIVLIVLISSIGKLFENVDAEEIVVIQDPVDGELHWYTTPGIKFQKWGKVTRYPKRDIYVFDGTTIQELHSGPDGEYGTADDGDPRERVGAGTRFNDGAPSAIEGSLQFDYPLDEVNLTSLHTKYGSAESVKAQLIEVVTDKAIFMTGPLLSSKESYSERRTDLISWAEDQVRNGIYKTESVQVEEIDTMTGERRTVTRADILIDPDSNMPLRQEKAQLTVFGIEPRNFAVNGVAYSQIVSAQIAVQQQNIMAVQTAIAEAKQAEQRTITVAQQGEANAAEAKWKQEAIKAKLVTEAEQRRDVAALDKEAAEFTKAQQILLGEGEAERKRLVLEADGALAQKLETYQVVMANWAEAYANRAVPATLITSGGAGGVGATDTQSSEFQQSLQLLIAGQMGLDLSVPKGSVRGNQ